MPTTELCQLLEWDSQFFGRTIGRINGHRLTPYDIAAINTWCADHAIECLYFLADSDHAETVRLAEDNGFRLVDMRVTLQCRITDWQARSVSERPREGCVRPALPSDLPVLQAIARRSHTDSRFYFDGCFPLETCGALYEMWITRGFEGQADHVLVAELEGEPVGYFSCLKRGTQGQVGLVGMSEQAHGRGLGQYLTHEAMQWFSDHGVESVEVVTQGRNIAAQRLYQRCGFLVRSVQLWYHKWFVNCTSREK